MRGRVETEALNRLSRVWWTLVLAVFAVLGIATGPLLWPHGDPASVLTSIRQVRALTSEQAQRGRRVHLQGVVTYFDPIARSFVVQSAGYGVLVEGARIDLASVAVGREV